MTTSKGTTSGRVIATAATTTTIIAALLLGAGCSQNAITPGLRSSVTSTTTAAATDPDYSALLIKDTDLDLPGGTIYDAAAPPTPDPSGKPGVSATFTNADGTDVITDTILVLPDAQAAINTLLTATPALGQTVTGQTPAPVDVGAGGVMQSGTSPDGSKSVTVLLFTQGRASITLEFDRPPADPVNPDYVIAVGRKQNDAITTGLRD